MAKEHESASSSDDVLLTVAWLARENIKAVPLHHHSKAALNEQYVNPDYRPPDTAFWKAGNYGVGAAVGPESGGLADIDLDSPEAIQVAPAFFPETTAIFGHAAKPSSHRLYRLDEPLFKKYMDPVDGSTLLEIRAKAGHQTVMPGSIHQDTGNRIWWSDRDGRPSAFPSLPEVQAHVLEKAASRTAMAALVSRHLWHDGQRNSVVVMLAGMLYWCQWEQEDTESLVEQVMALTGDDDKTRLKTVVLTYKKGEAGKRVSGAPKLRQFVGPSLAPVIDRLQEWAGSTSITIVVEYNDKYAVVDANGQYCIARTDVAPSKQPVFYTPTSFVGLTATDYVSSDDDKPVSRGKVWLASPLRRSYTEVDFMPGQDDDGDVMNLWTGWGVQPGEGSCDGWLELVNEVICGGDAELARWVLHWFANIVREPMKLLRTSIAMIGRQGAGKSVMLDYFGRILGDCYLTVRDAEHVHGRFNQHLANKLLLHSAEALYAGDRKHRSIIKSLITDETCILEPKNVNAVSIRNLLRLVLTSNEDNPAPVERDDRRFTIINLENRKISSSLIDRVVSELEGSGPAALHQYLLDMDYDPRLATVNIKNAAHAQVKEQNYDPIVAWWQDTLERGELLPTYLSWATQPKDSSWPTVVGCSALYVAFVRWTQGAAPRMMTNQIKFANDLRALMCGYDFVKSARDFCNPYLESQDGGTGVPQMVKELPDRAKAIVNFPSLDDCRSMFESYIGHKIKWPEMEEQPAYEKF